ncbi:hypothetical protein JYU34_007196 [Plutella xylostella]|uniref:Uncharacterized protein n=1 Tax=Plutella xylostella TaxID=51655 RepID=A0ABQ7QPT7_PLUXY|nr:hypothetical protein JYU34_007196 [Plutella xylostella]
MQPTWGRRPCRLQRDVTLQGRPRPRPSPAPRAYIHTNEVTAATFIPTILDALEFDQMDAYALIYADYAGTPPPGPVSQ